MSDTVSLGIGLWRGLLARLAGQSHSGARDMWAAFGYHKEIQLEHLFVEYLRGGIASRIIRAFPRSTWAECPVVRDEKGDSAQKQDKAGAENKNYSPFVEAVEDLFEAKRVIQYIERADRLASVGEYAVLVMGFSGGETMQSPLSPGKKELIFLQPYGQQNLNVSQWETDTANPRFGLPVTYTVNPARSRTAGGAPAGTSFNVHWSRVLHIAEQLDDNEVFGVPRLLPIMNYLMDLQKTVGAGAETYWTNSRPGTVFAADKDANISADDLAGMKTQVDEWEHQLRRVLALQGVTPHSLTAPYEDASPLIDALLDLIAGAVGMPKRLLIGSERGELASGQDENNWAARIDERRNDFAGPSIVRPFIQTMIDTGNLPKPQGSFWIEWPESGSLSPEKAALVNKARAETLASYSNSPNAQQIVPPQEFRTDFLDTTPESEYEPPDEPEPIDEGDPEARAQFDRRLAPTSEAAE